MNAISIAHPAAEVFQAAPFLVRIRDDEDYQAALELVETLIDEGSDTNDFLIERLADVIEEWEEHSPEFAAFNDRVGELDGIDMLKFLMGQYKLGVADLPEIGSKSYVSKILNRKRDLTRRHIEALSDRFSVAPTLFLAR